jgi:hypothetical protein
MAQCMVLMYMVFVHGFCTWVLYMVIDISFWFVWHEFDALKSPRIVICWNIVHFAEKIGGYIPIGGVIILPMILGGDIYQMHTRKYPYIWRKRTEA